MLERVAGSGEFNADDAKLVCTNDIVATETRAESLEAKAHALAAEVARSRAELMAVQAPITAIENTSADQYASTFRRITAPLKAVRRPAHALMSCLMLRPGSRPRHAALRTIDVVARFVRARPMLARSMKRLLDRFPKIDERLRQARSRLTITANQMIARSHLKSASDLSPHAREIYCRLRDALEQQRKSG